MVHNVAPVSCVRKGVGEGGYGTHLNLVRCSQTSHVVVTVRPLLVGDVAPAFRVRK